MIKEKYTRRRFLGGFSLGTVGLLSGGLHPEGTGDAVTPLIVTDHTNQTGHRALQTGWNILKKGGSALDAVVKAANTIELDPEDVSVGFGGLPNEDGVVQLDASVMDGKTYSAGAVACLEGIKTPCSVARLIMEKTDHVLMVGKDALKFAKKWGFTEENLLTEKSRKMWLEWKSSLSPKDDWGIPEHLEKDTGTVYEDESGRMYGTTNVLAIDRNGDIAGVTTTSGLAWKIAGRVGDSPIIGAGLYVDNDIGAAGATGRGEDVIKCCATYFIVMRMKAGRSPEEACYDALEMIIDKYKRVNPNFRPSEKFVAVNKKGEFGCAQMKTRKAEMAVMNGQGLRVEKGLLMEESG